MADLTTAILIVVLHGTPMPVNTFPSMAECEHHRVLVFEPGKTSTTRYECVSA